IGRDLAHMGNVAAVTLELVDEEVRRIVREAEATAKRVIDANAAALDGIANALLVSETLSGPALDVLLAAVVEWPEPLVQAQAAGADHVRLRNGPVDEDTLRIR